MDGVIVALADLILYFIFFLFLFIIHRDEKCVYPGSKPSYKIIKLSYGRVEISALEINDGCT